MLRLPNPPPSLLHTTLLKPKFLRRQTLSSNSTAIRYLLCFGWEKVSKLSSAFHTPLLTHRQVLSSHKDLTPLQKFRLAAKFAMCASLHHTATVAYTQQ